MLLTDILTARPAPVQLDDDGVARVGGTRVRLASVVTAFQHGSAPEEILLKFPSLSLIDIYAVVTYYLWHRVEVDAYLDHAGKQAEESRQQIEAQFPPDGVRDRLLSRRGPLP